MVGKFEFEGSGGCLHRATHGLSIHLDILNRRLKGVPNGHRQQRTRLSVVDLRDGKIRRR